MKKLIQLASLATIFVAAAATAQADNGLEGFSVQGSLGNYTQKVSIQDYTESGSDIGFGVRASYNFTPYVAADVGYFDFGEYSETYVDDWGDRVTDKVSTSAFKVGVTGYYPVADALQLFGRLGIAFWDGKISTIEHDDPDWSFAVSDSGQDIYFGFGAEYAVNNNLAISVEYSYLDIDATVFGFNVSNEITGIVAGIKYSF